MMAMTKDYYERGDESGKDDDSCFGKVCQLLLCRCVELSTLKGY